jgi:hypothetical protein
MMLLLLSCGIARTVVANNDTFTHVTQKTRHFESQLVRTRYVPADVVRVRDDVKSGDVITVSLQHLSFTPRSF